MKMKSLITPLAAALMFLVNTNVRAADSAAVGGPAKSVLDHYLKIQAQLAKDSTKGVGVEAAAIANAVNNDATKALPADVAKQADALANAKDLESARQAFKPLSASLIKYLADNKAGRGVYHEAFCPMANASWLQSGKDIKNPYMGKIMLDCGELKN